MNRVLSIIVIVGLALLIIGLVQIALKSETKLVGEKIVEDTVKFSNEDTTILSFNATRDNYRLRVEIEPLKSVFGGIEIKPLVFATLVDDQELKSLLSNKTKETFLYLKVEGLNEKKEFLIDNLSEPKRFHMLFSTPLPEQEAKVTITMIYRKALEPISPFDIGLSITGIGVIAGSLLARKWLR